MFCGKVYCLWYSASEQCEIQKTYTSPQLILRYANHKNIQVATYGLTLHPLTLHCQIGKLLKFSATLPHMQKKKKKVFSNRKLVKRNPKVVKQILKKNLKHIALIKSWHKIMMTKGVFS